MTKFLGILQLVAVALQSGPELWKVLPEKYHPVMHVVVSLVQAIAWAAQRNYNPDGTVAEAPYQPVRHG